MSENNPLSWYPSKSAGDHQVMIAELGTGRTVAVCYDKKDAPLIAAALDLRRVLKMFVEQYEGNGHDERERRPEMRAARAVLRESEGL